ncbi:MAG: MFS transporter [Paracoccus sp. (in: a-proteobacteria)]|uniref:MFS transporter n=1 Tax=Paracoccus sp. TaxID=267 RepID=UPI004059A15C
MTTPPFVHPGMRLPFMLLVTCFAAWGIAANMTDPLVQVFSRIFSMTTLQASLVQFAYYGAYFLLALPAAFINRRWSFKTGILTGLGCAILGAFLFYPAAQAMTFGFFLAALFLLAGGLSILETSANPFVMAMGPEANATRRLNLAQAFNPVGTNIGVLLAATLILPQLNQASAADRAAMAPDALRAVRQAELQAVMTPYVGFAFVLLAIWVAIALIRMPTRARPPRAAPSISARRCGGCRATAITSSGWSRSSSTWPRRPASGPSPSSTRWRPLAGPRRRPAGTCRPA